MADLIISREQFLQATKKLNKILQGERSHNLAFCQEAVSKSLGFRNFNALNTYFDKILESNQLNKSNTGSYSFLNEF